MGVLRHAGFLQDVGETKDMGETEDIGETEEAVEEEDEKNHEASPLLPICLHLHRRPSSRRAPEERARLNGIARFPAIGAGRAIARNRILSGHRGPPFLAWNRPSIRDKYRLIKGSQ